MVENFVVNIEIFFLNLNKFCNNSSLIYYMRKQFANVAHFIFYQVYNYLHDNEDDDGVNDYDDGDAVVDALR